MARSPDFEALYRAHYQEVCDLVRRHGVSAADAHDAAQDAFLKFEEIRDRYPDTPPECLLRSVAKNMARDFRKTDPNRKPVPCVEAAAPITPEEGMRASEGMAVLARIVRELPPDLRRIYVAAEFEGVRLAQIADELHLPLGTVKSRLYAARATVDATIRHLIRTNQLPAILLPLFVGSARSAESKPRLFDFWGPIKSAFGSLLPILLPFALLLPYGAAAMAPEAAYAGTTSQLASAEPIAATGDPSSAGPSRPVDLQPPAFGGSPAALPQNAHAIAVPACMAQPKPVRSHAGRTKTGAERTQHEREMLLIQNARVALGIGDKERALQELDLHKTRYPNGYMSQEREDLIAQIHRKSAKP
jgi:RNA polymerase sigma-70 factor (ECF subfamily)